MLRVSLSCVWSVACDGSLMTVTRGPGDFFFFPGPFPHSLQSNILVTED